MQNSNQHGRSMIEMLGVLAIIGVLTAGSLSIIGKARLRQELTQLLSETAEIVNNTKKLACQYDSGYGTYTNLICQSKAHPANVDCPKGTSSDLKITTSSDVTIKLLPEKDSDINYFVAEIDDMSKAACVYLATSDWGRRNTNGFIGAYFEDSAPSDLTDSPMDPVEANTNCAEKDGKVEKSLKLKFLACQCANCGN